jgi:hypothetical protein
MMDSEIEALVDNPDQARFELRIDDDVVGWAEYLPAGDSVIIAHTEIAKDHEGEGLGGLLLRATLDAIRARGKTVIPICPFAAAYIERNPELAEFVAPAMRRRPA